MFITAKMMFLIYILFIIPLSFSQEIGENCSLKGNLTGICTLSTKCSSALSNWDNAIVPDLCNTKGSKLVVCCPSDQKPKISKSALACQKYSKSVNNNRFVRSILGGLRALSGEFAHMAALGYINQNTIAWKCGGILISDQYVLTAAHCLKSRQYGYVQYVRLGDLDLDSDEDMVTPQNFKVEAAIPHPKFIKKRKLNDIALIKLNKRAKYTLHVFPACLYSDKNIIYDKLTAIGWGPSQYGTDKTNCLKKTDLDVFEDKVCINYYKDMYGYEIFKDKQFCAVGKNTLRDTCEGASGGPLLAPAGQNKKIHYAIGIVSFGPKCGHINKPGVYTRISYYLTWIESIVWP